MQTIEGIHYRSGQPIKVVIEKGFISDIASLAGSNNQDLPYIAPGLVDLQINGFKGVDFNSIFLTTQDVVAITSLLFGQGITLYYPTVITNSYKNFISCLRNIDKACLESGMVNSSIGGIHLEGPFISLEEGPVGAHDKQFVQAPDWNLFEEFYNASGERIKIITLSPEWPEAPAFTRKCVSLGIVVSIGHTAASAKQIADVVEAGATLSTHLGNATHAVLPRHPNYIWDQLADDRLHACFIGDGFHLPASVMKIIAKVKGDNTILVSDCVSLAGMPPGNYETSVGGNVVLTAAGKLHLKDKPSTLAGSGQTLLKGVQNLYQQSLFSLGDAWDMASLNPNRFLSKPHQIGLAPGSLADLVLFRYKDKQLTVSATYKNGLKVYSCHPE